MKMNRDIKKHAMRLILLFGVVSLLGDIIYEGARSVNGPYLATLGAGAAAVGLIAGIGEFAGYGIRLLSGLAADRMRAYWVFTFAGYGLLISVPLMAFSGTWEVAAVFVVCERLGKALRSPAKDTILSHAASRVGRGFGFGLHEAMDQIGAIAGPLIFAAVFAFREDYSFGYSLFWAPFALLMLMLLFARRQAPDTRVFEQEAPHNDNGNSLTRVFWIYTVFSALAVVGFANFSVIAFHLKTRNVITDAQIPMLYALAMGVDAAAALVVGRLYDKRGLKVLLLIPLLSAPIPFMAFTENAALVFSAMALWGVVMAVHETIMRAAIADLTSIKKRGTGYGIFNTSYGVFLFLGSSIMGMLYEINPMWIGAFTLVAEAASLLVFLVLTRSVKRGA